MDHRELIPYKVFEVHPGIVGAYSYHVLLIFHLHTPEVYCPMRHLTQLVCRGTHIEARIEKPGFASGSIPNNPSLPLLVYPQALSFILTFFIGGACPG